MNNKVRLLQVLRQPGTVLLLASASAIVLSGCTNFKTITFNKEPLPLLGPRQVIPAPYESPQAAPANLASQAEPNLPALPDDLQWLPVDEPADANLPPVSEPSLDLPPPVETEPLTYTVQKGDSLWKIARRYGVTMAELASANSMAVDGVLKADTELRIPAGGSLQAPTAENSTASGADRKVASARQTVAKKAAPIVREPLPSSGKHVVKPNDSLWVISRRYGVSMDELRQLNKFKSDVLQVGQVVVLPGMPPQSGASVAPKPPKAAVRASAPNATLDELAVDLGEDLPGDVEPAQAAVPAPAATAVVPAPPPPPAASFPHTLEHTVGPQDTLQSIAEMYATPIATIRQANPGMKDGEEPKPGITITVPYE